MARRAGRLVEVDLAGDETYDAVRDAVVGLGLGLVRMERRRHRMAELFEAPTDDREGVHGVHAH